jgi:hypothetical protein
MSLRSMMEVAGKRDAGPRTKPAEARRREDDAESNDELTKPGALLVAAIPTEVLAPYTALIGAIIATIDAGESNRSGFRWGLYAAGLVAIGLYMGVSYVRRAGQRKRRFPLLEWVAATLAFGAWALVMPGSPLATELTGDDLTIWTVVISVGGAFLVGLMTQPLKKPAKGP